MPERSPTASDPTHQARRRLGMLTPSSNTVLEPLCFAMTAGLPGVSVHFARFPVVEIALSAAALGQFAPGGMLEAARMLADARVDAICWNGTSASWLGLDTDRELCRLIEAESGIPATSAVLTMVEALREAGMTRVGLVTPYTEDVQRRIAGTLGAEGFEIVAERHSGLSENYAFATVPERDLDRMMREVAEAGPQAILVLCTNLPGAPLAGAVERDTGVPVFDSVAAALAGALAIAGVAPSRVEGWGRLFSGPRTGRADRS